MESSWMIIPTGYSLTLFNQTNQKRHVKRFRSFVCPMSRIDPESPNTIIGVWHVPLREEFLSSAHADPVFNLLPDNKTIVVEFKVYSLELPDRLFTGQLGLLLDVPWQEAQEWFKRFRHSSKKHGYTLAIFEICQRCGGDDLTPSDLASAVFGYYRCRNCHFQALQEAQALSAYNAVMKEHEYNQNLIKNGKKRVVTCAWCNEPLLVRAKELRYQKHFFCKNNGKCHSAYQQHIGFSRGMITAEMLARCEVWTEDGCSMECGNKQPTVRNAWRTCE
ncbi:MAG TPA: hypothetical protein VEA59_05570, partial [Patescibacteria group bacterium]|nr:hypothetical protein [Patescibacteria group bacterium]